MNELNKEIMEFTEFLRGHLKEVDSVSGYCKNVINSLEISEYYNGMDEGHEYRKALLSIYRGVGNVWKEYESLACCDGYLIDIIDFIKSGELVFESEA